MPLTLILMRHAKSSWGDPLQDDFDRSLNDRGRRSAPAIAKHLISKGYLPDRVLISGARRTVESWERMAPHFPETTLMASNPALYLAGPDIIEGVLRAQTEPTIMLIGHNPGIAEFAERVVSTPPDHPKFSQYPTAATLVATFPSETWRDFKLNSGGVLEFVVPRELGV